MKTAAVAVLLTLAATLSGCGTSGDAASGRTLTVLAASSLTDTFTELAKQFEDQHPGVRVKLVFDSSATLAQQAAAHAPGDVLATADEKTMRAAVAGDGVRGKPAEFATNVVVLAVPKDNPAKIGALADLDRPGVDYLTCVPTAPCGSAAAALLKADGVTRKPVSEEVDVRSVLTKVEAGEADAGLVYRTDVTAADGAVTAVAVPGADQRPNTYWVGVTANASGGGELARQWVGFLTGAPGRAVLRTAGFGPVG